MKQVSNMSGDAMRLKAVRMLVVATAFWGLSFPTTKALAVSQQALLPDSSSWFAAALCDSVGTTRIGFIRPKRKTGSLNSQETLAEG